LKSKEDFFSAQAATQGQVVQPCLSITFHIRDDEETTLTMALFGRAWIRVMVRKRQIAFIGLLISFAPGVRAQGTITTVAGNGTQGFSGDGGLATSAELYYPAGVFVDASGNMFIVDYGNNRIREVAASTGNIYTVAGDGTPGFSGDGGLATSAELHSPGGVFVDGAGNIFIADSFNSRIREVVASTGDIKTVAGNGTPGFSGDGALATAAELNVPEALFVDAAGDIFIADYDNQRIREVVPSTGDIKTVAGNGSLGFSGDGGAATSAELSDPEAVFVDAAGNVFIADAGNSRIREVVASTGDIKTVAGNGTSGFSGDSGLATNAELNVPEGVFVDAAGDVFIADSYNFRVREVVASTGDIQTIAGNGTPGFSGDGGAAASAELAFPTRLWGDNRGNLLIADSNNERIRRFAPAFLFVPLAPCRVADTRNPNGPFGGPTPASGSTRNFTIPNSACGISSTAAAYALNVTVVPHQSLGYLSMWPTGQQQPLVSTLNSLDGRVKANAAIVPAGTAGAVSVYVTDTSDVIMDINGYFVPAATAPTALAFYPVTPCRMVDTRLSPGSLAGPTMSAGQTRSFPLLAGSCAVPSTAQAYSLNFTAIPQGPLGYLSVWPAGQTQPLVSTLNALTGTITANAAIVPAGTGGAINLYTTNNADMVIDINGYFAPPGAGGLSLYTLSPCRVLDTRQTPGPLTGTLGVNVAGNACDAPTTAQAYVFNATVVPPSPLGYLTLWPEGSVQPLVSTLNAIDGSLTSNMAVVPAASGAVNAFASNPTQLILDISGYFAP
jgi:hypothetical protein